jgi:hypothetical protein
MPSPMEGRSSMTTLEHLNIQIPLPNEAVF